jgi:hypothetical protein
MWLLCSLTSLLWLLVTACCLGAQQGTAPPHGYMRMTRSLKQDQVAGDNQGQDPTSWMRANDLTMMATPPR